MNSVIKAHRNRPDAFLPERIRSQDACYDVWGCETITIQPGCDKEVPCGISLVIPDGYYVQIQSRSGLKFKQNVTAFPGIIDAGFTGEISILLRNHGTEPVTIEAGSRVAQLAVYKLVDESKFMFECSSEEWKEYQSHSERKSNGFGSSDNKQQN